MKKILLFLLIFISVRTFAQYPNGIQTLGSDSNVVQPKGGFKARVINWTFTDTTQANTQHIKEYPGAQIFTTSDNKFWLRNANADGWIGVGSGGGSPTDTTGKFLNFITYVNDSTIRVWIGGTSYTIRTGPGAAGSGGITDTTFIYTAQAIEWDSTTNPGFQTIFVKNSRWDSLMHIPVDTGALITGTPALTFDPVARKWFLTNLPAYPGSVNNNIYNVDSLLSSNRTVGLNSHTITFSDITGTNVTIDPVAGLSVTGDLTLNSLTSGASTDSVVVVNPATKKAYWRNAASFSIDTTSLSNRINSKVNISDTSGMLTNYRNAINTNAANILLKQNLVTLTTTGTSGASTFNQGTGALNIPQYSSGGITKAYAPLIVTSGGDSIYQRYNVKAYGAVGNGITDDTRAIQRAINACYNAGGGQVFFPNGKYLLADTLVTGATFTGGIRYGTSNSQLYIPCNQTPFTAHPLVNIDFIGETAPNMFISRLVPYPTNTSGVILYSNITGSGTYPSILGTAGDAWAYGNINDAQISIRNINFRVKANIAGSGPTMSAVNMFKMSSIGYIQNVLCDVDTASYYAIYPTALTFGIAMPYANNSAFNPLNNSVVTGYKYGYIFSEHTTGNNLVAGVCEYGYLITGAPHAEHFGRLGSNWNKYSIANGSPNFGASSAYIGVGQLDVEQDTVALSWTLNRYTLYDSTNSLKGDITYHNNLRGTGVNEAAFNKSGGTNALLQLRAIGSFPDTSNIFSTVYARNKARDSVQTNVALKENSLGNPGTNGYILSSLTNGTRSWIVPPAGSSSSGIFTRYGVAGTDSLKAFAQNYYRVGIYDTGYSRFSVTTNNLLATANDTSGIMAINTTAATVGVQQNSPMLVLAGNGWKTTATAGSQTVRFGMWTLPVQGTTNPTGTLNIAPSINGAAYSGGITLTSTGTLTVPSLVANSSGNFSNGTLTAATTNISSFLTITATSLATTPSERLVLNNATAATSGVPVQYSPTFKIEGRGWTGAASQLGAFAMEVRPVNGTSPITANFVLKSSINAAAYNDILTISDLGKPSFTATNTTVGTTGNQTINKASGTVNIAAAGTAVTVTNSLVTTSSIVFAVIRTNDATARISNVVPAAGSFTINIVACTAEVSIGFFVIN